MSVIYEVTLHVDRAIADAYDAWLERHVAEMLALPGFLDAEVFVADDAADGPAQAVRVVHYRIAGRAALDAYFHDHAGRMRDDGVRRFGTQFSASRRILQPVARKTRP